MADRTKISWCDAPIPDMESLVAAYEARDAAAKRFFVSASHLDDYRCRPRTPKPKREIMMAEFTAAKSAYDEAVKRLHALRTRLRGDDQSLYEFKHDLASVELVRSEVNFSEGRFTALCVEEERERCETLLQSESVRLSAIAERQEMFHQTGIELEAVAKGYSLFARAVQRGAKAVRMDGATRCTCGGAVFEFEGYAMCAECNATPSTREQTP